MDDFNHLPASILAWVDLPFWEIAARSTIAIAAAAIACRLLRRQSAALRHGVLVVGLAASLVVPMAALLVPQLSLAVLPSMRRPAVAQTGDSASAINGDGSSWSGTPGRYTGDRLTAGPELDAPPIIARTADASQAVSTENRDWSLSGSLGIEQVLVLCWLVGMIIGAALLLFALTTQLVRLRRLRRIEEDDWTKSVAAAAKQSGLKRPVIALESDAACVPAVAGVLRPRLLIPANWRTWSQAQRNCILLHELAHVKRRDVATQLLGRLAIVVYWFNPLAWHAARQLRVERELAADDCVLLAGQAASDYAQQLLYTLRGYRQGCRKVRPELGVAMAQSARLDQRVLSILDQKRRRGPVGRRLAIVLGGVVGVLGSALCGVTLTTHASAKDASANQPEQSKTAKSAATAGPVWKENYTVEYPAALPVSVAFSADGKTLLTGDTAGEVMALIFAGDEPQWRWKAKVAGSHAAVAFSTDQKKVYATTEDGVRILDAAQGKEEARIEAEDSNPTAIGVIPDKRIADAFTRLQIVFGTPRGYFVKSWAEGKLADTLGTIETSTVAKDAKPQDEAAVPLAVDPNGRSAIMTGPIDPTGAVGGVKGKNVLWAYVCGDYEEGSPGNRVMPGHIATVVSAAWAKEGGTAVTGDAAGRVILWDAKTMKETRRLELGGRVAALALSDDGARTAAYVIGKQGELYVWDTAQPDAPLKPIHTELGDFGGPQTYASLSFSPDGKRLAGCAVDKKWLARLGELVGKVRVWELAAEPKAQLPPKHAYVKPLPKGSSTNLVMLYNDSMLVPAAKEGAVDVRRISDGEIQARIVIGKFSIGAMKLSTDRKWLAMEQRAPATEVGGGPTDATFEVGVYQSPILLKATIALCSQLLDIASGGKVVAVVREKQIELWDIATTKKLKSAPFEHGRIDAAAFSPSAELLAIAHGNELVLWHWEDNRHERIDLGRSIGSLAFSPDGKFLAEGPKPGRNLQIRDLETRTVVQSLTHGANLAMNVPRIAYTQGGRVLIACDTSKVLAFGAGFLPQRIHIWDTGDGSLVHNLTVPAGLSQNLAVSPNGRYLVAMLADGDGVKLSGWRLDGQSPENAPDGPPAAEASKRAG